MDKFFVYGTLKVGGAFAGVFDEFRINSKKAVLEGYDLYNLGWFPGIIEGNGKVMGEIHEYKSEDIDWIRRQFDRIEGYSEIVPESSMYLRKELNIKTENGDIEEAYVYVFNKKNNEGLEHKKIEHGFWPV